MTAADPDIVFAGDRDVAVEVLTFLDERDVQVSALLLPEEETASHDEELLSLCHHLSPNHILRGGAFRETRGRRLLTDIAPDYILSVHFQYVYPKEVLDIPGHGVVNLHPAYLPYNRGWHTPSWAIWDQTPVGATIHFMDEEIDAGPIIARRRIDIRPDDTADSLYKRVKSAEVTLFKDTWPAFADFSYETSPQSNEQATVHRKADLEALQEIDLHERIEAGTLIRKLRALTTNKLEEAAYFEQDGKRYRIQVDITPERDSK